MPPVRPMFRACLVASVLASSQVALAAFQDELVQPDTLSPPDRASLIGSLATQTFGPDAMAQGTFALPLPLALPDERGGLLLNVTPSYQMGAGAGVWGQGWHAELTISRTRYTGHLDGVTDAFVTPWGRLTPGNDGHHYVLGFAAPMRFTHSAADQRWSAVAGDGTVYTFEPLVVAGTSAVFEWYATEVRSVVGHVTRLRYSDGIGRRYLDSVTYGGRADEAPSYEVSFAYEELARPIRDFAFGYERVLARRVSTVTVLARPAEPEAPPDARDELWSYALSYRPSAYGPAFYLASITRSLPGAQGRVSEPPVTYEYNDGADHLATAQAVPVASAELTAFFAQANHGGSWIQPQWTSSFDDNRDGVSDFENAETYRALRSVGGRWEAYDVPAAPGADRRCRPDPGVNAPPRTLIKLLGPEGETYAVKSRLFTGSTSLVACRRSGEVVQEFLLAGGWDVGARVRLTDVNRDQLPDLIRLENNRVQIRFNQSSAGVLAFGEPILQSLTPNVPTSAAWFHDMNGDGWGDLVGKLPFALLVWYGRATGGFVSQAAQLQFIRNGTMIPIGTSELAFRDANGDGLADVVVTLAGSMYLYMNQTDRFSYVHTLDDRLSGGQQGMPVAQNLTEGGEDELLFSMPDGVRVMELTQPSTGLLTRADDGRGNAIAFAYGRGPIHAGLPGRPPVVASITHTSSGLDDVLYTYDFATPVVHPEGRFLVGFGSVVRQGPDGTREEQYFHDGELRNIPTLTRHAWHAETDPAGTVAELEWLTQSTHAEASHLGVRLRLPDQVTTGLRPAGGTLQDVHTTRFLEYTRGVCAVRSEIENQHGKLSRTIELATPAALVSDLHCLAASETLAGTHTANPTFDFVEARTIDRNDLGQPTRFSSVSGNDTLVLQDVGYNDRHRVYTVTVPGRGTTTLEYDAVDRLTRVTSPDGVVTEAPRRSRADLIEALAISRGEVEHERSFRYDDFLRLGRSWDSFRGGSDEDPLERVAYEFASATELGATHVTTAAELDTDARIETVAWIAGDGTALASATWAPDDLGATAWVVSGLVQPSRDLLTTTRYNAQRYGGDWRAITADALRAGALELGVTTTTGAGTPRLDVSLLQSERELGDRSIPPVTSTTDCWYAVASSGMTHNVRSARNDDFVSASTADLDGNLIQVTNQDGDTTHFAHDAAGRLRRVTLADGTTHTASFDGFGRPSGIARDGIGRIALEYEVTPTHTDRVAATRFFGQGQATATRVIEHTYDSIGRTKRERHRRSDGNIVDYDYGYDGAGTTAPGQLGHQTEVLGPSYSRHTVFNPNGTIQQVAVTLGTWRRVTTSWTYNARGDVAMQTRQIADAATGTILHLAFLETKYDLHGRPARLLYNGQVLVETAYDHLNRPGVVSLDPAAPFGAKSLVVLYDEETRARAGTWIDNGAWNAGIDWVLDERGLVDFELLTLNDTETLRDYGYDKRGFLESSADPTSTATYQYDSNGLISQITDLAGTRTIGTGRDRLIGGISYRYDALGRLIKVGDLILTYGPHGQISTAKRASQTWNFTYDEAGNRVLKRSGTQPVAGYVDGIYIDADHVIEPVRAANVLVGVMVDGAFELLATDPRGSIWVEPNGTTNMPSPYGIRAQHPELAAALDYVEKGYDADLGFVRMGVRDYAPFISQFATPDPLFLADIGKGAESPVEVNLFSYARSNPIGFVDPTGLQGMDSISAEIVRSMNGVDNATIMKAQAEGAREATRVLAPIFAGMIVGGGVGGIVAGLRSGLLALMAGGAAGGATGSVAATATNDAINGQVSSPGTYARNALIDGAIGAGTGILAGVFVRIRGATSGTGAFAASGGDGGDTLLYRGVTEGHPGYDEATAGMAFPRGGHADPALHNIGDTESIFTSWTRHRSMAEWYATKNGNGVVLKQTFPASRLVRSPDLAGEGEVLVVDEVVRAFVRFVTRSQ
jgi:RHS repeat-associated protein